MPSSAAQQANLFSDGSSGWVIDPWIASSLMQKAIRRGDVELAVRAADALYTMRGSSVFRRLAIVACEDVGIAGVDVVIDTVAACADAALRKHAGGNAMVLAHLVERLALSPKDRSADLLASVVHGCPKLAPVRAAAEKMSVEERIAAATDPKKDFFHRAVAAWYASGIEWGREKRVGKGDLIGLLRSFRDIGIAERWCVTGKRALAIAREPLIVMMLLLSAEAGSASSTSSVRLPSWGDCGGIPSFAFDKHTRLGLQAIRRFAIENAQVKAVLSAHVPEFRATGALGVAAFYCDGSALDVRLDWALSDELEVRGITSDLLSAGVFPEGVGLVRQTVADNLAHLNDLRAQVVQARRAQSEAPWRA